MIFYYTGTGNTLNAAKQMQKELGEELAGELVSITACIKRGQYEFSLAEGEYLGFMMPVFFWGVPASAGEFLRKVQVTGAVKERNFLLVTCGGAPGGALEDMEKKLALHNIEAASKMRVVALSNYTPSYAVLPEDEQQEVWKRMDETLREFAERIRQGGHGDWNEKKPPLAKLISPIAYSLYSRRGMKTNKFRTEDRCTSCGFCQKLCPVEAITMEDGRPVWTKSRCDRCLACYHRCPVNAVQIGTSTVGKGQYVHPVLK